MVRLTGIMIIRDIRIMKVRKIEDSNKEGYVFFCPGCKERHQFSVPPWTFNGDKEKPTIRASILVHACPIPKDCVDPDYKGHPRCHSIITDGKIQFLGDCDHELKGQIVDLEDF